MSPVPRFIDERPTTEQWDEITSRYGRPQMVHLRWDRSARSGIADHAPRSYNVVLFITDPSSRVLFVQKEEDGEWFLPMGGVEVGQSVEDGAAMEGWEEAGVAFDIKGVPAVYVIDEIFSDGILTRWNALVQGATASEAAMPHDLKEIAAARFFASPPAIDDRHHREWLDDILARVRP